MNVDTAQVVFDLVVSAVAVGLAFGLLARLTRVRG